MAGKNLLIELEEIMVEDVGAKTGEEGTNVLNFVVVGPRPGVEGIATVRAVRLQDKVPFEVPREERVLFKDRFEGPFDLLVEVTAKHEVSRLTKAVLGLFKTAVASATAMLTGGIATVVAKEVIGEGRKMLLDSIKADDKTAVVAKGWERIDPAALEPELHLGLEAREDVYAWVAEPNPHNRDAMKMVRCLIVPKGKNGFLKLRLTAF